MPDKKLAVLINADNVPHGYVREMLAEISRHGTPTSKRIYANWTRPTAAEAAARLAAPPRSLNNPGCPRHRAAAPKRGRPGRQARLGLPGALGTLLLKRPPDFDFRNYGFPRLGQLVRETSFFEVEKRTVENAAGKHLYVRVR